jgi:hypothetical protein
MLSSEVCGSFPNEGGELASGGQASQGRVIHADAERRPVIGAGQADLRSGGLVGLVLFAITGIWDLAGPGGARVLKKDQGL